MNHPEEEKRRPKKHSVAKEKERDEHKHEERREANQQVAEVARAVSAVLAGQGASAALAVHQHMTANVYSSETRDELEADNKSLMGKFISWRELSEITEKRDYRISFTLAHDTSQHPPRYRIGKQMHTTFFIGGVEDKFNTRSNVSNSFESYLDNSTSWNMFQAVRALNDKKIYDEHELRVYIQDTLDVVADLMDSALVTYQHMPISCSKVSKFRVRLHNSDLSLYDELLYFIRYIYELLALTSGQHLYMFLETLFAKTTVPMKWFLEKLDIQMFATVGEFDNYYDNLVFSNRREYVEYTLKYHEDNLYDSHNLGKAIRKFLEMESLDEENYDIIAQQLKSQGVKKDITLRVELTRTVKYLKLELQAMGLPTSLETIDTFEYELQFSNFIESSPLEQTLKYKRLEGTMTVDTKDIDRSVDRTVVKKTVFIKRVVEKMSSVKSAEPDTYVQFEEIQQLLQRIGMPREDIYDFIEQLAETECQEYKGYQLTGVIADRKTLGRQSKASAVSPDGQNTAMIEFRARKQASPRHLIGRNLAVLKVPKKNIADFKRETLNGLYPHQIAFINATLDMAALWAYSAVIYNTVVSSGKTTSVVSLAFTLKQLREMTGRAKMLIYTTWSLNVLKEVFIKSKEIKLDVLSAFANANGNIVIKRASSVQDKNNVPFDEIVEHDILICHPLTLMKLLATTSNTLTDAVVVIDELNSGNLNSVPEHVLGSLISLLTDRQVHMCLLSASIQKNKHINYLNRYGKTKLIESSNILVPTTVRQFDSTPMDIFNWTSTAKSSLTKVLENSFFRRFINPENVCLPSDYIVAMKNKGIFDHSVMLEVFSLYGRGRTTSSSREEQLVRVPYAQCDEMKCIKAMSNYTLVACVEPQLLADEIYDQVIEAIKIYLATKILDIRKMYSDLEIVEAQLKDKCYCENKVKSHLLEKVKNIEERLRNATNMKAGQDGQVDFGTAGSVQGQITFIKGLLKDSRFTPVEKMTLASLCNFEDVDDDAVERITAKPIITSKERDVIQQMSMQTLTKSERLNLALVQRKQKLLDDQECLKRQESHISDTIRDTIINILGSAGIQHKFVPTVVPKDVIEWNKDKTNEYIWKLLGVFVETKKNRIAPSNIPLNRLFGTDNFARGVDLAVEAVIITNSFAEKVSSDTILQMSGRCGRPGKSKISIVYMSAEVYDRIFRTGSSADIHRIMLRSNYYLQNQSQVDVLEMPSHDSNFIRRLELLLDNMRK
jgi:hypothetical protein